VLPVYSRRIGPGRYHAHVDPAILPPARGAGRGAAVELMQHVADRFEGFIAAHPDQWYAFRPLLGE
jgi:lauroyl/myristoyl acyltransferase